MLRLAGIPISELTHLSEFQRNSEDFKKRLDVFNDTKPVDTSDTITDSESDIDEKDLILMRNVLVLMLDYQRKDLPIAESKDIKIYTRLVLGNVKHLFTELDKTSADIMNQVKSEPEISVDFATMNTDTYRIYKEVKPKWMSDIDVKPFDVIKTNHLNKYTGDSFLDFVKFHSIESQYPIFAIERKDYVTAVQQYYDITFNDTSASVVYTGSGYSEFVTSPIPYRFKSIDIELLGQKLNNKLFSTSNLYNPIIPNTDTFKHYLTELYFSDIPDTTIEHDDESYVLNSNNIYDVLSQIDILEEWTYD